MEFRIKHVLAGVLENGMSAEEIGSAADLVEEYGLDSLQMIAFLLGIEDEFGLELDYETWNWTTCARSGSSPPTSTG